jgi:alkylated DNA repair protein alkB family protein 1
MTAHLDDAEEDQKSPIFSFAFGLSCVFIIGDTHKDA